jgi:uncharacterized protein YndB with AHSA1/START domain
MFKIIVIIIAVLVVAILIYAATKPDTFRCERSALIQAPPEKLFALINDFHQWRAWSPYEKLDPAMQRSFSGATTGKGSVYSWEGNSKAGTGSIAITDTNPPGKIVMKLDMLKPFEGHNIVEFTLQPSGAATQITWAMNGPASYLSKLAGVFLNMDKMVGGQFAEGLANLKAVAENK